MEVSFIRDHICRLFKLGPLLLAGCLLWGCLDIPSDPDTSSLVTSVSIFVEQYGKKDSTYFKINSNDSAAIVAKVHPQKAQKDLQFYWINGGEILDSGSTYLIYIKEYPFVPDSLVIVDKEGNKIGQRIRLIVNAPPTLSPKTVPADGDTIVASRDTPIQFQWKSFDPDYIDHLSHTLVLDGVHYELDDITSIKQSGFGKGKHLFKVIVTDAYGDMDSTRTQSFYVIAPKENN